MQIKATYTRKTQKLWQGTQNWNYESLFLVNVVRETPDYVQTKVEKLRIRVKRDAYDHQSYAVAELFNEQQNQWNEVASNVPKCLATVDYTQPATIKDFLPDEKALWDEVKVILGN